MSNPLTTYFGEPHAKCGTRLRWLVGNKCVHCSRAKQRRRYARRRGAQGLLSDRPGEDLL